MKLIISPNWNDAKMWNEVKMLTLITRRPWIYILGLILLFFIVRSWIGEAEFLFREEIVEEEGKFAVEKLLLLKATLLAEHFRNEKETKLLSWLWSLFKYLFLVSHLAYISFNIRHQDSNPQPLGCKSSP